MFLPRSLKIPITKASSFSFFTSSLEFHLVPPLYFLNEIHKFSEGLDVTLVPRRIAEK